MGLIPGDVRTLMQRMLTSYDAPGQIGQALDDLDDPVNLVDGAYAIAAAIDRNTDALREVRDALVADRLQVMDSGDLDTLREQLRGPK